MTIPMSDTIAYFIIRYSGKCPHCIGKMLFDAMVETSEESGFKVLHLYSGELMEYLLNAQVALDEMYGDGYSDCIYESFMQSVEFNETTETRVKL